MSVQEEINFFVSRCQNGMPQLIPYLVNSFHNCNNKERKISYYYEIRRRAHLDVSFVEINELELPAFDHYNFDLVMKFCNKNCWYGTVKLLDDDIRYNFLRFHGQANFNLVKYRVISWAKCENYKKLKHYCGEFKLVEGYYLLWIRARWLCAFLPMDTVSFVGKKLLKFDVFNRKFNIC